MNIVFVYADNKAEWNSSEWRCVIPAKAIDQHPDHQARLLAIADFTNGTSQAHELCTAADVIVVERNLFGPVLTAIIHWKAQGKGVIVTFDDAYHLLPEDNLSHDFWIKGIARKQRNGKVVQEKIDPPPITQFKWGLRMVDGAVVASQKLVEDWMDYTDVRHLPMFLDFNRYQKLSEQQSDDVVIGWSGSLSHLHSFSGGILIALERVARSRRQVRIKIGNDRRIYDKLKIPKKQKALTPWVPYEEWPEVLASYDIGLAPMEGEFDARRSWVKVLEYMAVKIPWVASKCPAYESLEEYGGLVVNTPEAWESILLEMVDKIEVYHKKAAGTPYQFARSQSADQNVQKIIGMFSEITGRKSSGSSPSSSRLYPSQFKQEKIPSMRFNHALQGKITDDQEALELVAGGGIIVDVGAGYGGKTLNYLKVSDPSNIYAFEPLPHNIALLQENVQEEINFFPYACGEEEKLVSFEVPNIPPISGRLDRNGIRADYIGSGRVLDPGLLGEQAGYTIKQTPSKIGQNQSIIKVPQVRLDSILPPGEIKLLKVDVQGYEENVLRGLGDRLEDVAIAYIEYEPQRKGAAQYLLDHGFELYDGKYIVFGPPKQEQYLKQVGFTNIYGFRNSAGKYRYDCSIRRQLFDKDLFNLSLREGFFVNETDLICINKKVNITV